MLDQNGSISFVSEIMDAVDTFLREYESHQGPLRNDLERGLVISYVLGIMHCEMQKIWDELGTASAFGSLHPRLVFENCLQPDRDNLLLAERLSLIKREARRRGWIMEEDGDNTNAEATST